MTEPIRTEAGVCLAWDQEGTGPAVVLLHGIGSDRKSWEPQVAALSSGGFRVVRFDLRGFGDSSGSDKPCAMADFVGDLNEFVSELALPSFHLVGHSLGGMIAQRYALSHPQRLLSLVLVSTTSHNGRRATAFARLMVRLAEHGFDALSNNPELRGEADLILAEAFPSGVSLSMLRAGIEEPDAAHANAWRACIDYSTKDELGELRCPVLVAHGTADRFIPFGAGKLLHGAISHSEWFPEEGSGHALSAQRAESFNPALLDFLGRVERSMNEGSR